jgi:acetyl-CoA carboxylase biotin carboxyl carrier protein
MGMATEVTVPMVGKIVAVTVKVGDTVVENDQIATLEAMKMEMPVVAPTSGVVKTINVKSGDEVTSDTVLMIIE